MHTHTCTHMFIYTHMSAHTFMPQKRVCVVGEGWSLSVFSYQAPFLESSFAEGACREGEA